jgi:hypothetical protein
VSDRQIKLTTSVLKEMLLEAYQSGWYGVLELGEEAVEGIVERRVTEEMVVKQPPPLPPTVANPNFVPFVGLNQPVLVGGYNNNPLGNINVHGMNVGGIGGGHQNIIITSGDMAGAVSINSGDHTI